MYVYYNFVLLESKFQIINQNLKNWVNKIFVAYMLINYFSVKYDTWKDNHCFMDEQV